MGTCCWPDGAPVGGRELGLAERGVILGPLVNELLGSALSDVSGVLVNAPGGEVFVVVGLGLVVVSVPG